MTIETVERDGSFILVRDKTPDGALKLNPERRSNVIPDFSYNAGWTGERWDAGLDKAKRFKTREEAEEYLHSNRIAMENS